MAQNPSKLPPEVWNNVFGYLSATEKLNVRATCKYFKTIVDHRSLWKNWTVVLDFKNGSYNRKFWDTLRHRKVSSAVMKSTKVKHWKQLALFLPILTTVVMDQSSQECFSCLKDFPNMRRLVLRSSCSDLLLDISRFPLFLPEKLTYLSMCGVMFPTTSVSKFISVLSQFKNLDSLICHQVGIVGETMWMLHSTLTCLPKLKHLSLSGVHILCTYRHSDPKPSPGPSGDAGALALASLELIDCMDPSLPAHGLQFLPGLKHLSVFFKHSHHDIPEMWSLSPCRLKTWLHDLPQLSTLIIVKGPPVNKYITSIPATVTSLTLCVAGITSKDMAAIAVQLPNLLHLHIDTWPSHLGTRTAEIPRLFPKLKSLKIRHERVPEQDFLQLRHLQHLRYLEILDSTPQLSVLTGKLQALTEFRLQIRIFPYRRDALSCPCVCHVY